MLDTPDTPDVLKSQAKRLAAHLKKKYGWNMALAGSLEAIAISRGYRDWNTCVAALTPEQSVDRPITIPVRQTRFAELFTNNATPSMEQVVAVALSEHITDIRLPATPHSDGANLVYVHSEGKYSLPIGLSQDQLRAFVRTATLGLGNSSAGDSSGQYGVTVGDEDVFVTWSILPALMDERILVLRLRTEPNYPGLFEKDEFLAAAQQSRGKLFVVAGLTGQGKTVSVRAMATKLVKADKQVAYVHPDYAAPVAGAVSFAFGTSPLEVLSSAVQYARSHGVSHLVLNHSIGGIEDAQLLHQALQAGVTVVSEVSAGSVADACAWLKEKFPGTAVTWAEHLGGVRRQSLLPKMCAECSGAGCTHCEKQGTKGVVLAFENALFTKPEQLAAVARGEVFWHSIAAYARHLANAGLVPKKLVRSRYGLIAEK